MKRRIELELTDPQIAQLRAIMDGLPLNRYAPLVLAVLKQLPLSDAAEALSGALQGADATPAQSGAGVGFTLLAFTDKGKAGMAHLAKVLDQLEVLPHGDSL